MTMKQLKPVDEKPKKQDVDNLKALLKALGLKDADLSGLVSGKSRIELADALRAKCKQLKKKKIT